MNDKILTKFKGYFTNGQTMTKAKKKNSKDI